MLRIQEALCQDKKILPSKPLLIIIAVNIGMRKHNVFRFARKRWYKPAEKNRRGASAEELRYYKARHIGRPNPGKGVRERSCKRYRQEETNFRDSNQARSRPLRVCLLEQRR
jgi:hypothetical protein